MIEQKVLGWSSLAVWVIATIVGGPIVYLLPQQALALVDREGWLLVAIWSIAGVVFGALAGAIVGLGQRFALRSSVPWAHQWVGGTVIGWTLGGAILMSLTRMSYTTTMDTSNNNASLLETITWFTWFAFGAAIGFSQWLILRQHVRRAAWWIGASSLGWGLSVVVIVIAIQNAAQLTHLMEGEGIIGVGVVLLIIGLVSSIPGVVTVLALNILISQNNKSITDVRQ